MKEAIGDVLDKLSECLELKMGLNIYYEQTGGIYPDFKLNIWNPDISEKLTFLLMKLDELGLSYRYVERGFFTYLQIYTPKNSLNTTPSRAAEGWY